MRGAAELADLIARREISSVEAVTEALERADRCNALATRLDESALEAAAARDREAPRGPLHGVPVTVKTSLDLAGSPTTSGNPSRAHVVPERTGPEAEGYVRAGAVVVGRGNAPDFSLRLHTDNELHGATLNALDATRSPGGSGGGEAVAVATGLSALGLGGDVGGSLRIPAQWNRILSSEGHAGAHPVLGERPRAGGDDGVRPVRALGGGPPARVRGARAGRPARSVGRAAGMGFRARGAGAARRPPARRAGGGAARGAGGARARRGRRDRPRSARRRAGDPARDPDGGGRVRSPWLRARRRRPAGPRRHPGSVGAAVPDRDRGPVGGTRADPQRRTVASGSRTPSPHARR